MQNFIQNFNTTTIDNNLFQCGILVKTLIISLQHNHQPTIINLTY